MCNTGSYYEGIILMFLTSGSELVIASHNKGKLREIAELLTHFSLKITSSADYGLSEPEETEETFEGNALLKARYTAKATGKACLADDSGLSVTALGGLPGIYSARWAGEDKDFTHAMRRVEQGILEKETEDYSASFFCALAFVVPEKNYETVFLGEIKGHLTFPPRGDKGFGYDPIFIAQGMDKTFSEIDPVYKYSISHRADAFRQLAHALGSG